MLTFKLAFRNLFRNTRRTVLTCLLIGFSLSALIIVDGVLLGTSKALVESITHLLSGEAQVHRRGFLDTFDADLYIADPDEMTAVLRRNPAVAGFALRTISRGMVSSTRNVSAAAIYGVDPDQESRLSRIKESVIAGNNLSGGDTELMIGSDLVDLLQAKLGDRIVLTMSMVNGGGVSQELFRLSGITEFGVHQLDSNAVFINLSRAKALMGMGNGVHEIAIRYSDEEDSGNRNHPLLAELSNDENEALGWRDFNPEIGSMLEIVEIASVALGVILLLLASFGVTNTMFMSIYERIYEFGIAKSIGTRPNQLIMLVLCEALVIALMSVTWGSMFGSTVSYYLSVAGFSLGEMVELPEVTLDQNLYSVLEPSQFLVFPGFVILLTLAAAFYPARFASRIVPSEALQKLL